MSKRSDEQAQILAGVLTFALREQLTEAQMFAYRDSIMPTLSKFLQERDQLVAENILLRAHASQRVLELVGMINVARP